VMGDIRLFDLLTLLLEVFGNKGDFFLGCEDFFLQTTDFEEVVFDSFFKFFLLFFALLLLATKLHVFLLDCFLKFFYLHFEILDLLSLRLDDYICAVEFILLLAEGLFKDL